MLALTPAAAAIPAAETPVARDHCNGTQDDHNGTQGTHNGAQEHDKGTCLALCGAAHGGVLPQAPQAVQSLPAAAPIGPVPAASALTESAAGLDPPPPRFA